MLQGLPAERGVASLPRPPLLPFRLQHLAVLLETMEAGLAMMLNTYLALQSPRRQNYMPHLLSDMKPHQQTLKSSTHEPNEEVGLEAASPVVAA